MMATKAIPLRAFKNQVGGNFLIMEIDENFICKPMQTREKLFYECIPEELKKFTPRYKGKLLLDYFAL